jgi:hypothetical protein
MGTAQWLHVDVYGDSPLGGKASAAGMIAELDRKPQGSNHLKKSGIEPKQPIPRFLASTAVSCVIPLLHVLKAENLAKTGRPARKNAALLLGGVASWPVSIETIKQSKVEWERKEAWSQDLDAWIKRRWPTVYAIVEHVDETYPHHHWICMPFSTDKGLALGYMHPGKMAGQKAKEKAKKEGKLGEGDPRLKHAYNLAYKKAMQELLDDYYESVGKAHGLDRLGGTQRSRVSRKEQLSNRKAESQVAAKLSKLDRVNSWLKTFGTDVDEVLEKIATVAKSNCNSCATVAQNNFLPANQRFLTSKQEDILSDAKHPTKSHQQKM